MKNSWLRKPGRIPALFSVSKNAMGVKKAAAGGPLDVNMSHAAWKQSRQVSIRNGKKGRKKQGLFAYPRLTCVKRNDL
jgi:hypothetical protein